MNLSLGQLPDLLRDAVHRYGLRELWQWWLEQLHGLMPPRVLHWVGLDRGQLQCLPLPGGGLRLFLQRPGSQPRLVGQLTEGQGQAQLQALLETLGPMRPGVDLLIPAAACFCRPLSLPLATESNLAQVLRFEMDRHTPFQASQVLFDWSVRQRDAAAGRLLLALVVVPRERITEALTQLRALDMDVRSVRPERVDLDGVDPRLFDLMPRTQPKSGWRPQLRHAVIAAWILAVGVTLLLPLWLHRSLALDYVQQADGMRPHISRISDVQARLDSLVEIWEEPQRQRLARAGATELIAELTRLLPDGTWLYSLRLEAGEVFIDGESASASSLIEAMENSDLLTNVRFLSSLQSSGQGRERFSIGARVLPAPLPEGSS